MIHHCHKQIKKHLAPQLHLILHCAAPLKRMPRPDNEREIVCPELGIVIRRVCVRIPSRAQDRAALDAGLETLFAERETL